MAASDPTRLNEIFHYVGDNVMGELPSLRQGTQRWSQLVSAHPTLQDIKSPKDFGEWIDKNQNSGVSPADYANFEKHTRYSSFFPKAHDSEVLQQQLQSEIKSEQADTEAMQTGDGQGHGSAHGLEAIADRLKVKRLDQDRDFKRILKTQIEEHNRLNPDKAFTGKAFIKVNGDKVINPNLPAHLLENARGLHTTAYGQDSLGYLDSQEAKRTYKSQENDPALKKLETVIARETQVGINTVDMQGYRVTDADKKTINDNVREKFTAQFVKDYPEKAEAYAKNNPEIAKELELYKETQKAAEKLGKENKKIYRLSPEKDPAVIALRNGSLSPSEFVRRYPEKAKAYRNRIKEIGVARETYRKEQKDEDKKKKENAKLQARLRKTKDPALDTKLQEIRNKYPNRANNPTQQRAFEREMEEFVRNNKRAKGSRYRNDTDIKNALERVGSAKNYGKRPGIARRAMRFPLTRAYSGLRFITGNSGYLSSAGRMVGSGLRAGLGPSLKGISSIIPRLGGLGKIPGLPMGGGSLAARGAMAAVAALGAVSWWVWVAILIGIIAFIILFGDVVGEEGEVSVSINKSGPEAVENPVANEENLIEYTINVSYSGPVSSLTVTDYLPEELEYVSSEGPVQPTQNGNVLTWNIAGGGSGGTVGSGQNTPPSTDTCGGVYDLSSSGGQNFGDPTCELANAEKVSHSFQGESWQIQKPLFDMVQQMDPQDAGYWFGVIQCESNFHPSVVAIGPHASGAGVYGLYQMGASYVNGRSVPYGTTDGLNGEYDRGDVHWSLQTSNAINYQEKRLGPLGMKWEYWACARMVWGLW